MFVAILDTGSLTAAARRLLRSPPAITRALAALEKRLGARLIERTTRRLIPTATGQHLGAEARHVLAAYGELVHRAVDAAPRGLLRITAPLIFGRRHVTPVVASFLEAFPEMQAELTLADRYLDLTEESLDAALRIGPPVETLPASRRLGEVRRIVVASPGYLAARGEPRTPEALMQHAVVHVIGRPLPSEWRFRAGRRERVVRLAPRLTVNEIEAALVAVRTGHGITRVLSYQVAEELEAGTLVRLLRDYEPPPLPVSLVAASDMPTAGVRAFLAHAIPLLSALPVVQAET
ncbi:MAG TPA: LysR family transcriptional regulator [Stellaceae bacterium]|nr:LysR family transcriptional regulator [Stellaceae bacterium]